MDYILNKVQCFLQTIATKVLLNNKLHMPHIFVATGSDRSTFPPKLCLGFGPCWHFRHHFLTSFSDFLSTSTDGCEHDQLGLCFGSWSDQAGRNPLSCLVKQTRVSRNPISIKFEPTDFNPKRKSQFVVLCHFFPTHSLTRQKNSNFFHFTLNKLWYTWRPSVAFKYQSQKCWSLTLQGYWFPWTAS